LSEYQIIFQVRCQIAAHTNCGGFDFRVPVSALPDYKTCFDCLALI